MAEQFGDYYREIYARGLAGEKPELPVPWDELEAAAAEKLDAAARAYVYGGAGTERTMRGNLEAFGRWRIVPRMMRDVSERDLQTSLLGLEMPAPVMLAPIGVQEICRPDGELETARAAAAVGLPLIASTAAAHSLEKSAEANGDGDRWYQLYMPNDRELAASIVGRAEKAGYKAIVLTVDNFVPGWKPRDLAEAELPFLKGVGIANYLEDPVFRAALEKPPEEDIGMAVGHFLGVFTKSVGWDDLEFLRGATSLPVLLKGVLHPEDARQARDNGADGIVVSNHGGRQVDGAIPALDALPGIAEAVGDEVAVLFDSGIRSGADILKALALGAKAVLVGRPYLWGLTLAGETGVETVLRRLLAELDLTLALSGYTSPEQLDTEALAPLHG